MASDMEPIDRVRATKSFDTAIKQLLTSGFNVFVAREKQTIVGGVNGPGNWWVLHIIVARHNDSNIVRSIRKKRKMA